MHCKLLASLNIGKFLPTDLCHSILQHFIIILNIACFFYNCNKFHDFVNAIYLREWRRIENCMLYLMVWFGSENLVRFVDSDGSFI